MRHRSRWTPRLLAVTGFIGLLGMAACQRPGSRGVELPQGDSLAALVRSRFRLDLSVAYQAGSDPTRGVVHVWNATDSLVAPMQLVLTGEPPAWNVSLDDPMGALDAYLLDADREASSDSRWRACRAEGRSALACAAAGHEYNYRELVISRGAPPDLRVLDSVALEEGLTQLFDATRAASTIVAGTREFERQAAYAPGTGALIYFHATDTLYSWVVTGEGIETSATAAIARSTLSRAVAAFREELASGAGTSDRAPTRSEPIGVHRSSKPEVDLIALLLPPTIAEAVVELERLVVVPVLNLGTLPFQALPSPRGYLADDVTISVAPSLWDLFSAYPPALGTYTGRYASGLIVGNPDFSGELEWRLPSLPGAEAEAAEVASFLDGPALVGAGATEERVLEASGLDVYHFATHGISNQQDPLQGSFLALSGGGRLTALEIQERGSGETFDRPWGNLVVMSACQTGLGMTDLGGIIGLARAFQLTGTPNVVMSLWNVDDEATAELMRHFYQGLQSGRQPAEALRLASIGVRERYPSPSVWAAFTVLSLQQEALR